MERNELFASVYELEKEKSELVNKKSQITSNLLKLKNTIRTRMQRLPQNEYNSICKKQEILGQKQREIEKKLSAIKVKLRQKDVLIHSNDNEPFDINLRIIELKNKYMDFSSDNTRVNSMRLLASQFAQELDEILKLKNRVG